jgi:hypothetical protein
MTESRCIIHIGTHKTGSTSIQRSLQGLDNDRFLYARLSNAANHSLAIYSAFATIPERHHLHRFAGRDQTQVTRYIDRVFKNLDRSIEAARGRTLVISGEDISSLPKQDLQKLRDYFDARFGSVQIVGYVRPPAGFLTSSFQQRVKGTLDFFDLMRMYRKYRATFGKFDKVFGRARVQLWKFDPKTFPEGDVVRDFCNRLEIALPRQEVLRLNESLSAQAIATFYVYNKFSKRADKYLSRSAAGRALIRLLDGEKFRLSPDAVRRVLDHNSADIKWMEKRLGQPLREDLGEHRDTDVRDERDLLRPNPEVAAKLLKMLGRSAPKGVEGETPQEIAALVDAVERKWRYFDVSRWKRLVRTLISSRR